MIWTHICIWQKLSMGIMDAYMRSVKVTSWTINAYMRLSFQSLTYYTQLSVYEMNTCSFLSSNSKNQKNQKN